jgi:hypothetical protein
MAAAVNDITNSVQFRTVRPCTDCPLAGLVDGTRWRDDPGNRRRVGFYNNSVIEVGAGR